MLASFTIVRILQTYRKFEPGAFERSQVQNWLAWSSHQSNGINRTATDRQKMTLVMSSADGCPIHFGRD